MTDPEDIPLKKLGKSFMDSQMQDAARAPRKRVHHNLHPSLEDPVQRMCVAMEPGSYFRPHRHSGPGRWEMFIALRGAAAVLVFDEQGTVLSRTEIRPHGETTLVEIPAGAWHNLCILEPGTVLFESKPGPYAPLTDKDFASWAPPEETREAHHFARWFRTAGPGDTPPEQA